MTDFYSSELRFIPYSLHFIDKVRTLWKGHISSNWQNKCNAYAGIFTRLKKVCFKFTYWDLWGFSFWSNNPFNFVHLNWKVTTNLHYHIAHGTAVAVRVLNVFIYWIEILCSQSWHFWIFTQKKKNVIPWPLLLCTSVAAWLCWHENRFKFLTNKNSWYPKKDDDS